MMSEKILGEINGSQCVEEEISRPSSALQLVSITITALFLLTSTFLILQYSRKRKRFAMLRDRSSFLSGTAVFGSFLQLSWSIDIFLANTGFPCFIINNLHFSTAVLQFAPRCFEVFRIYQKMKLNRQLSKFEVLSTLRLGLDHRLNEQSKLQILESITSSPELQNHLSKNPQGSYPYFFCRLTRRMNLERLTSRLNNLRLHMIGNITDDLADESLLDGFPSEFSFFLASKKAVYLGQALWIVVFVVVAFTKYSEILSCFSPCKIEPEAYYFLLSVAFIFLPYAVFILFLTRNEFDPLKRNLQLNLEFLNGAVFGSASLLLAFFNVGNYETNWNLLWTFGSLVNIVLILGYPLLLVRKQEKLGASMSQSQPQEAALTLEEVLETEVGRNKFKAYLVSSLSIENYLFYQDVLVYRQDFGNLTLQENNSLRDLIVSMYVSDSSPLQVNISGNVRVAIENKIQNNLNPAPTDFDDAFYEVTSILRTDCFPRFKQTFGYKELLFLE